MRQMGYKDRDIPWMVVHKRKNNLLQLPSLPSPSGASSDLMLSGREDNETGRAVFMDRQLVVKTEEEVEEEEEVTILRFKKAKVSAFCIFPSSALRRGQLEMRVIVSIYNALSPV